MTAEYKAGLRCHGTKYDIDEQTPALKVVGRGKTEYDLYREEISALRAKRTGSKEPDKKVSNPQDPANTADKFNRQKETADPRFYHDLQAARYQKLYRMCLVVEKKNSVEKLKAMHSMKKYGKLDFFDIPFFAENENFVFREGILDLDELKTEEERQREAWYLSVFQFIAYKTYQRVRVALMKLIKHKGERRVAQIAAYFRKFKHIGAKRIITIYSECNHTKVKAEVLAQWKRRNDKIRENFEAKILNERKQVLEAQKNEELEKKKRLEKLSGVKIKNGVLVNTFVQSLERVSKENFGPLRQAATGGDLAQFTKLIVKGSLDMYQSALEELSRQNIESPEDKPGAEQRKGSMEGK